MASLNAICEEHPADRNALLFLAPVDRAPYGITPKQRRSLCLMFFFLVKTIA